MKEVETTTKILVFEEKHGTRYFAAKTKEQLFAACLMILKQRNEQGWYPAPSRKPDRPDFDEESIPNLPESMQETAKKKYQSYKTNLRYYEGYRYTKELVEKAVAENNGALAYEILEDRSDGEYERMQVMRTELVT